MDKNFVHIDDLFREGLSGAEEPEQAGAWLRMQELLDAQMPSDSLPVTGGRWPYRRYLTALLVLLCTGSGAYIMYHQWNNNTSSAVAEAARPTAKTLRTSQPGNNMASHSAVTTENKLPETTTPTAIADNNTSNPITVSEPATSGNAVLPQQTSRHTIAHNVKNHTSTPQHTNNQNNTTTLPEQILTEHTKATVAQPLNSVQNSTQQQTALSGTINPNPKIASGATAAWSTTDLKATETALLEAAAQQKIYQNEQGDLLKENTDTINQVVVRETTVLKTTTNSEGRRITQPQLRTDTLQEQRIAVTTLVLLSPLERTAAAQLKVEPVLHATLLNKSVLYASGERAVKLVTLSKYAVASKQSTPERINQMISNTSNGISNMFDGTKNYYAGIIAGGNLALGNPAAYGLQVGIAGFYALSERLTAGVELRYVNRYYSNYQFLDRYTQYSVLSSGVSGGNWIFNYEENVQSSTYRVQNIATVELPVYLNYSFGRLSVFGGANFAYAFDMHPIVNNEVATSQKTISSTTQNFPIQSAQSQVTPDDWKRRFGIGYTAGMAYDINRRFTLDVRLTQNLWDNASSEVSKEISKKTFRVPSLQLGVTVNFGRRDKVIYILDNRGR